MADDTLALLDQLGIDRRAHFVGWSDGAVIASYIAATKPGRVNQLVMFGAAYQSNAYIDAFSSLLSNRTLFNEFLDNTYGVKYAKVNPNPESWPAFRDTMYSLWNNLCYFADYVSGGG